MEFNDIANVGETHRTHCDCNALHRHVHKCAYASATGTVSAWYKTCIAVSMSVPVHLLQAQCPHGIRPVSLVPVHLLQAQCPHGIRPLSLSA